MLLLQFRSVVYRSPVPGAQSRVDSLVPARTSRQRLAVLQVWGASLRPLRKLSHEVPQALLPSEPAKPGLAIRVSGQLELQALEAALPVGEEGSRSAPEKWTEGRTEPQQEPQKEPRKQPQKEPQKEQQKEPQKERQQNARPGVKVVKELRELSLISPSWHCGRPVLPV
jgi:outer membrane biosynthesis protein TonB